MYEKKLEARKSEFDFVKSILIILVVWGHVCSYISDYHYDRNQITSVVRLFQMPMFIMISGYFSKESKSFADVKHLVIKTVNRLLYPYLIWSVIGVAIVISRDILTGSSMKIRGGGIVYFLKLLASESNILWYLGCLFLCTICYAFFSWLSNSYREVFIWLSGFSVLLIPYDLWHFSFLYPFFLLGSYMRKINLRKFINTKCLLSTMLIAVLLLIGSWFIPTSYTFYNSTNFLLTSGWDKLCLQLGFVFIRYVIYVATTICYFLLFLNIYEVVKDFKITKSFCNLGTKTMGVFLVHILLLYHIFRPIALAITDEKGFIPDFPFVRYYILGTAISYVTIVLSVYIIMNLEKHMVTKKLFLGKYT